MTKADAQQDRPQTATGPIQLRLLTGETIPLAPGEFLRISLHPYLLAFYLLLVAFIFAANASPARDAVPLGLRLIGYGSSVLVGVGALFVSAALARRLTLHRTGREVIPFPVNLAITIFCSVLFGEVMTPILYAEPMAPVAHVLLKIGFYIVVVEVAAAVMLYLLLPRILSHLRGRRYRSMADLALRRATGSASAPRLAENDLPILGLIRMEVDGDLIRIITQGGTRIAQGPLAQVAQGLPDEVGIMVHRSDWVARAAVVGTTRIGRSRALRLSNGDVVRVASSRDAVVAQWLRGQGLE